ncbi:MFS transporter [Achromobacter aloeverae]|uniref:MFS transporter n=1 Tax=Achromobacter aloeverae TaxID=1750518 RepID=A0A4Q1HGW7_9BURK|nr:MFS transporter [Achromobacter aloeverae]RXN86595.1 MFS transporter [Achromobacter aloeverae]
MSIVAPARAFFGSRVIAGTFLLAVFGWGVGFYGPPVYLQSVVQRGAADVTWASAAVTWHFVLGAFVVANLPRLYRRAGVPRITVLGAAVLAVGVYGWGIAATPAQLFLAATFSGAGWVTMGAAAVNALIAPWYVARRPSALGMAYNGASLGGVVFSPLWVLLIGRMGLDGAAMVVGLVMVCVMAWLAGAVFRHTPASKGQRPDGGDATAGKDAIVQPPAPAAATASAPPAPLGKAWRDRRFLTLCAGMALGLFAQIGLIAHLFSLLVPVMGEKAAGVAMGLCTACAILGRMVVGRLMPPGTDRRRVAAIAYGLQVAGVLGLLMSVWLPPQDGALPGALRWLGLLLFGSGIGNATSLPPLIAQTEFTRDDAQRVIPLIVAVSQGTYAFAPALFGLLRDIGGATWLFPVAAAVQVAAIAALLAYSRNLSRVA